MRRAAGGESLGNRVFLSLIVGEVLFALVLGVTFGMFSALTIARQHEIAIRRSAATIAAGLMPMVADQQVTQVRAQLSSILETAEIADVEGIRITGAGGEEIASGGEITPEPAEGNVLSSALGGALMRQQTVEQPIVVDGLLVATVLVTYAAPGLSALWAPVLASSVVLLSVLAISVPWTAWRLTRDVFEPLEDVEEYATQIAGGTLEAQIARSGVGEIGDLQESLGRMAQQLRDRDEEIRGSYASLEDAYASLEQAKSEIEHLSQVKSNFVAVAAHEIRSPLAALTLYAQLLESGELGEAHDERIESAVAAIASTASRLRVIVSDLMDAALLERGMLHLEFGEVWLDSVIGDSVRDAAMLGERRHVAVVVEGEPIDAAICGDALRLHQVLSNLLSNAVKYSPDGTTVIVRGYEEEDWVEVEVADQGRGIPEGSEDQLFALFGRLDFGDSRDTAGLGLGLAISARIVEAHGGSITYRANEACGSVFSVRLPVQGPPCRERETSIRVAEGA